MSSCSRVRLTSGSRAAKKRSRRIPASSTVTTNDCGMADKKPSLSFQSDQLAMEETKVHEPRYRWKYWNDLESASRLSGHWSRHSTAKPPDESTGNDKPDRD